LALAPPARFGRTWILAHGPIFVSVCVIHFSFGASLDFDGSFEPCELTTTIFPRFEPFSLVQFFQKLVFSEVTLLFLHDGTRFVFISTFFELRTCFADTLDRFVLCLPPWHQLGF
jgi:hypothetical protein